MNRRPCRMGRPVFRSDSSYDITHVFSMSKLLWSTTSVAHFKLFSFSPPSAGCQAASCSFKLVVFARSSVPTHVLPGLLDYSSVRNRLPSTSNLVCICPMNFRRWNLYLAPYRLPNMLSEGLISPPSQLLPSRLLIGKLAAGSSLKPPGTICWNICPGS